MDNDELRTRCESIARLILVSDPDCRAATAAYGRDNALDHTTKEETLLAFNRALTQPLVGNVYSFLLRDLGEDFQRRAAARRLIARYVWEKSRL
jgi:hypothetical protein